MAGGFAVAVTRWAALFGVHHKRHSEGAEGRGGGIFQRQNSENVRYWYRTLAAPWKRS